MAQVGPAVDLPVGETSRPWAAEASDGSPFRWVQVPGSSNSQGPSGDGGSDTSIIGSTPTADQATVIRGLRVDAADPESVAATGLTIELSGPISIDALTASPGPAVELLDGSGRAWTSTPTMYDRTKAELSFAFDRALPPGAYTLVAGDGGGLVDPEGRPVIATGQASGVLGSFVEAASPARPDDFGVLAPGSASAGSTSALPIAADGTASRQFVVLVPAYYAIEGVQNPRQVNILAGPGTSGGPRQVELLASDSGGLETFLIAGVYRLNLTGQDPLKGVTAVTLRRKSSEAASLLGEGIGQAPSQATRLLAPSAGPASGSPSTNAGISPSGFGFRPTTPSMPASSSAKGSGSAPAALGRVVPEGGFLVIGQPVGRPSSRIEHISVVVSSSSRGSIALASNGMALPAGLVAADRSGRGDRLKSEFQVPAPPVSTAEAAILPPVRSEVIGEGAASPVDRRNGFDRGLALALEAGETSESPGERDHPSLHADAPPASTDRAVDVEDERPAVEVASFASLVGLVAGVVIAIHYRRARKARMRLAVVPSSIKSPLRGPHHPQRVGRPAMPSVL